MKRKEMTYKVMPKDNGYRWVLTGNTGSATRKPKEVRPVYELEVTLVGIEPPIWRRFTVPHRLSLAQLHDALLAVMGWQGGHLYEFIVDDVHYADPDWDDEQGLSDATGVRLDDALTRGNGVLQYVYDWGDYWQHVVRRVGFRKRRSSEPVAKILEGERACPPEDVGGVGGYMRFLEAMAMPTHLDHQDLLDWVGGQWDAERFDLGAAQRRLTAAARRGHWTSVI